MTGEAARRSRMSREIIITPVPMLTTSTGSRATGKLLPLGKLTMPSKVPAISANCPAGMSGCSRATRAILAQLRVLLVHMAATTSRWA